MPADDNNEFPAKYMKKLDDAFIDTVNTMSEDDIKERIVSCEGNLSEIENAKKNDQKLQQSKELSKELSAPYRESHAIETAKIRFLVYTLEQRGVNLNQ